jgi:hypothetical protein
VIAQGPLGGAPADWTIARVGDYNGDGKSDILFRQTSGLVYTWLLNGVTVISQGLVGGATTDWQIQ